MTEEINILKIDHALLNQKQIQTDEVIKDLRDNLKDLSSNVVKFEGKVTKGFYIACGIALVSSGALGDLGKLAIKFIGM